MYVPRWLVRLFGWGGGLIALLVLAVQNLEASGIVSKSQDIEFKALEGSLSMMSKGASDAVHTEFQN